MTGGGPNWPNLRKMQTLPSEAKVSSLSTFRSVESVGFQTLASESLVVPKGSHFGGLRGWGSRFGGWVRGFGARVRGFGVQEAKSRTLAQQSPN